MNYMHEFAEMLGVELDEEFDILIGDYQKLSYGPYRITREFLVDRDGDGANYDTVVNLLRGVWQVKKLHFQPKDGDTFWYVDVTGVPARLTFKKNCMYHLLLVKEENCFLTKEDAASCASYVLGRLEQ